MGWSRALAVVAAIGMLTACAAQPPGGPEAEPVWTSAVDPTSPPAFLDEEQQAGDIPVGDWAGLPVDPASTRYQGEYRGQQFFLATMADGVTVVILSNDPAHPENWGAGSASGNAPLGAGVFRADLDDTTLVYQPHGTARPPAGWEAFSDWLVISS